MSEQFLLQIPRPTAEPYTDEQIEKYEELRTALLVPDPWDDPLAKKCGLLEMYIRDSIAEVRRLLAERNPEVRLHDLNPVYKKYTKLLNDVLHPPKPVETETEPLPHSFDQLVSLLETHIGRELSVQKIPKFLPDIRIMDTPDECLSWLYTKYP
jgi:hypothetical protein